MINMLDLHLKTVSFIVFILIGLRFIECFNNSSSIDTMNFIKKAGIDHDLF